MQIGVVTHGSSTHGGDHVTSWPCLDELEYEPYVKVYVDDDVCSVDCKCAWGGKRVVDVPHVQGLNIYDREV